jgi:hypothetical protein
MVGPTQVTLCFSPNNATQVAFCFVFLQTTASQANAFLSLTTRLIDRINRESQSSAKMNINGPPSPPHEAYNPERFASSLEVAAQQIRLAGPLPRPEAQGDVAQILQQMQQEMRETRQEMRDGFQRVNDRLNQVDQRLDTLQTDVATINVRLHNIEAQSKNEDARQRHDDYIPLLKRDGTPIPNFPLNEAAVRGLSSMYILFILPPPLLTCRNLDRALDGLLTDLGVAWEGRNLDKKKALFLREIGVKTTHNG